MEPYRLLLWFSPHERMTRGHDRPRRFVGAWQEQEFRRRRLSTALEQTQFGVHQTEFAPELCSAAAALLLAGPAFRRDVPAVGVAQASAGHDIAQSTAIERGLAINFWPEFTALQAAFATAIALQW